MSQLHRALAFVALLGWLFVVARRAATTSRRVRRRMILVGVATLIVVPAVGYRHNRQVPDTHGSPATLVGVTLTWLPGWVFLLFAVPSLIGALAARPASEDDE